MTLADCRDRLGGVGVEPPPSSSSSSSSPTSLEPRETIVRAFNGQAENEYRPDLGPLESWPWIHRGWEPIRRRVHASLIASDQTGTRIFAFGSCCEHGNVFQDPSDGELRVNLRRCGDRMCGPCGRIRSLRIQSALSARLEKKHPIFGTLTVRGRRGDRLADVLKTLMDSWRELRRLGEWKSRIDGGAAFVEVKWSDAGGGHWHPHLHFLADGRYLEQGWLSRAWQVLTGGSPIVHLTRVRENGKATAYVAKYASKPLDKSFTHSSELIAEAIIALKGKRLCTTFGTWRGTPLKDDWEYEDDPLTPWVHLGSLCSLRSRRDAGEAFATLILSRLDAVARISARASPPAESS